MVFSNIFLMLCICIGINNGSKITLLTYNNTQYFGIGNYNNNKQYIPVNVVPYIINILNNNVFTNNKRGMINVFEATNDDTVTIYAKWHTVTPTPSFKYIPSIKHAINPISRTHIEIVFNKPIHGVYSISFVRPQVSPVHDVALLFARHQDISTLNIQYPPENQVQITTISIELAAKIITLLKESFKYKRFKYGNYMTAAKVWWEKMVKRDGWKAVFNKIQEKNEGITCKKNFENRIPISSVNNVNFVCTTFAILVAKLFAVCNVNEIDTLISTMESLNDICGKGDNGCALVETDYTFWDNNYYPYKMLDTYKRDETQNPDFIYVYITWTIKDPNDAYDKYVASYHFAVVFNKQMQYVYKTAVTTNVFNIHGIAFTNENKLVFPATFDYSIFGREYGDDYVHAITTVTETSARKIVTLFTELFKYKRLNYPSDFPTTMKGLNQFGLKDQFQNIINSEQSGCFNVVYNTYRGDIITMDSISFAEFAIKLFVSCADNNIDKIIDDIKNNNNLCSIGKGCHPISINQNINEHIAAELSYN